MALEGPYSQLPGAGALHLPLVDAQGLCSGPSSATDRVCGPRETWHPGKPSALWSFPSGTLKTYVTPVSLMQVSPHEGADDDGLVKFSSGC